MGMYTSVVRPTDGKEIQIKTGDDALGWYHVGDKVQRYVHYDEFGSGCCFDNVYLGIICLDSKAHTFEECWVVIKDGVIHSVIPCDLSLESFEDRSNIVKKLGVECGYKWYWYDPRAMLFYYIRQFCRNIKYWFETRKFKKSIAHLSPEEQFNITLTRPLIRRLNYDSIAKKMFKVKQVK